MEKSWYLAEAGTTDATSLATRETDFCVVSCDPERATSILGDREPTVRGDITSPVSVEEALKDASALVIAVSAVAPGQIGRARLLNAMRFYPCCKQRKTLA